MTETPDETQEPDAPLAPAEPSPEEAEEAEEQEQAQTPAEAAASHGSDEIPKKLERAIKDQQRRLSKIVGVDLAGQECPTCDGMGYTIGGSDPAAEMVHPENLVRCEACNGYGQWVTGSRNELHVLAQCMECTGFGYKTVQAKPANVTPITPEPLPGSGQPQMGFMNPDGTFVPFGATPMTVPQSG